MFLHLLNKFNIYKETIMGASVSTNSTKLITKAILNVSDDIIQDSVVNNKQEIIVNVENSGGDVNIDGIKSDQVFNINSRNLFKSLSSEENNNKVNQEIEKITKSLISGLSLSQISASISTLNNVIENCINIKNSSLTKCSLNSNQLFKINEKDNEKNVNITNIVVNQLSSSTTECISRVANMSKLSSETDEKISQVTSSSTEGIDVKWLAIAGAAGFVGVGVTGVSTLKFLLGPIISSVGGYICYLQYSKENVDKVYSSYTYLKNSLNTYDPHLSLLSTKDYTISNNNNFKDYGEADVYECFGKKISLYKGTLIKNLVSDVKQSDLDFSHKNNILYINVKDSSKYSEKKQFVIPIKTVNRFFFHKTLKDIEESEKAVFENDDVIVQGISFDNSKIIHIYYIKEKVKTFFTTYELEPTIIGLKQTHKTGIIELAEKNTLFLIGIGMVIGGILLTVFLNKNT